MEKRPLNEEEVSKVEREKAEELRERAREYSPWLEHSNDIATELINGYMSKDNTTDGCPMIDDLADEIDGGFVEQFKWEKVSFIHTPESHPDYRVIITLDGKTGEDGEPDWDDAIGLGTGNDEGKHALFKVVAHLFKDNKEVWIRSRYLMTQEMTVFDTLTSLVNGMAYEGFQLFNDYLDKQEA